MVVGKSVVLTNEDILVVKNLRLRRRVCELEIARQQQELALITHEEEALSARLRNAMNAPVGDLVLDLDNGNASIRTNEE